MKKIVQVLFVLVISIGLLGCKGNTAKPKPKSEKESVQETAENFLNSFEKGDYVTCRKFMTQEAGKTIDNLDKELNIDKLSKDFFTITEDQKNQLKKILHQLFDKMVKSYKINKIEKNNDTYVVDVSINGISQIGSVLKTFQKKFISHQTEFLKIWKEKGEVEAKKAMGTAFVKYLQETVDSIESTSTYKDFSTKLSLKKVDDKWLVSEFLESKK